jgi:hypothetical protein
MELVVESAESVESVESAVSLALALMRLERDAVITAPALESVSGGVDAVIVARVVLRILLRIVVGRGDKAVR